jgi:drug/metabolite transporter (DMT)-like permease
MAAAENNRQRVVAGILLKLGAVVCLSSMHAIVKLASEAGVHTVEVVFFRSLFGLIPIAAFILVRGRSDLFFTRRPMGHLVRSSIGLAGMFAGFASLARTPLAEFTTINFAAPLFITMLSVPVLGEKVGPHRWAAVAVGFVGVLIALRPDPVHLIGVGPGLAVLAAVGTAGAMVAIRQIGATEPGATIAFYFTLLGTLVAGVFLPFVWTSPSLPMLGLLLAGGLLGGVGQLLLSQAFKVAPVAAIAPFDYAALLWTGLLGYLIWSDTPAMTTLVGGAVIIASGLYIFWRELVLRRRRRGEPA